jgi:hypothetical protein
MDDDRLRASLKDLVDSQLVVDVDVDREWAKLVARAASESAEVARRAGRQRSHIPRGSRLAARVAVMVLVAAVLSATLLLARATKPKAHTPNPTTTTLANRPYAYRPTGPVPRSFVAYAASASGQQTVAVYSSAGRRIRVLTAGSGLYHAQDLNGVLVAPNGRTVYYLDQALTGGVGIYRTGVAGGRPSRVASGLDPAVSPNGELLAIQTYNVMGYVYPIRPLFSVLDLASSRRTNFIVSSLFRDPSLSNDAVAGLAWLAGTNRIAALLEPAPSACSMLSYPDPVLMKCPIQLPPQPTTIAIVQIVEHAGTAVATGVRLVQAPAGFGWRLVQTGPAAGGITLIGDRGTSGPPRYQVFAMQLSPRPQTAVEIGRLPDGCVPFSFDAASGAVICEMVTGTNATSDEIVRLDRTGRPRVVALLRGLELGNASWIRDP